MLIVPVQEYWEIEGHFKKEAETLIQSCQDLNLNYEIDAIDSLGSWEKNCCFKPQFIGEKLKKLKTPVLWVDVDARIIQKPDLFLSFPFDFSVYSDPTLPDTDASKVLTGTVYASFSEKTFKLLALWNFECQTLLKQAKKDPVWDQVGLRNVLKKCPFPHNFNRSPALMFSM